MQYVEVAPRNGLEDYIACFWSVRGIAAADATPRRVLPDGCVDIIFDFGEESRAYPAYVVGTMSRPLLVTNTGSIDILGIRFLPGGSRPFLRFHVAECTNNSAELSCFFGKVGLDLWERTAARKTTLNRITYLETYLLEQFGSRLELDPYVQYAVRSIKRHGGNITMKALEKGTGLCERQIERKFARDVGLAPKAFARVVRFENVIRAARARKPLDWPAIALESGYADQPHLVREFKEFSGLSPTEFFNAKRDVGFVQDHQRQLR